MPLQLMVLMILAVTLAAAATVLMVTLAGLPGAAILPVTLLASVLLYRRL